MSRLILVRHGQASWGASDYDVLSDLGRAQGRAVGAALAAAGHRPDRVVTGSLRRQRDTADELLAEASWGDVERVQDAGWDEYDHSVVEGGDAPSSVREALWQWASGAGDTAYAESFATFTARVTGALERVVERAEPRSTTVVVASGGSIGWAVTHLLGGDATVWTRLHIVLANGSLTHVSVGSAGPLLRTFNAQTHLEAEPGLLTLR